MNKILGAMFLLMSVSIVLIGGLAALQSQSDLGDTVVNNSSSNYETYQEIKNTTNVAVKTAGYAPYIIMLFMLVVFAVVLLALAAKLPRG
ncbi:MAG: hypothetical protein KAJ03_07375 [Gammaproteobacteria bacterium]|nr:hypothetical protein [Gammaproteobacteria bacterium]